jgi:hypothetical protein
VAVVRVGEKTVQSYEASELSIAEAKRRSDDFARLLGGTMKEAGYPARADPGKINYPLVMLY